MEAGPDTHRQRAIIALVVATAVAGCGGGAAESASPDDDAAALGSGGETTAGQGPLRVGGTGYDYVSEQLRARHPAEGEGRAPVTDVLRARLDTSASADFAVSLEGGSCYVVLGVGVPSVRDLELSLIDEFGTTRAEDDVRDAFPSLRLCPRVDADWTVRLRVFEGYGSVGAQVFGGPP